MRYIPVALRKWQTTSPQLCRRGYFDEPWAVLLVVREHKQIAATSEATDWFVRFFDDGMSRQDRMRYLCWLKQSPVHVAETLRLMRIYRLLCSIFLPRSDADAEDEPPDRVVDGNRSDPHRPH
jgi:hypothetical protein